MENTRLQEDAMRLAEKAKQLRLEQGLTQPELAKKSGLSHATIENFEAGRHKTSVRVLDAVFHALGRPLVVSAASGWAGEPMTEEKIPTLDPSIEEREFNKRADALYDALAAKLDEKDREIFNVEKWFGYVEIKRLLSKYDVEENL
jgi:transcriptional regulator with XRE-family HTH domain